MLVSCSYCGGRHTRGQVCPSRPKKAGGQKEANYINRFRSLRLWKRKRDEIKGRDKYLCQYCKKMGRYTFQGLQVHHITPIGKDWSKRLENANLITLCVSCHKMAEMGDIPAAELEKIASYSDSSKFAF